MATSRRTGRAGRTRPGSSTRCDDDDDDDDDDDHAMTTMTTTTTMTMHDAVDHDDD
jgi:hypothetical protein